MCARQPGVDWDWRVLPETPLQLRHPKSTCHRCDQTVASGGTCVLKGSRRACHPAFHRLYPDPVADGKLFLDQHLSQRGVLFKGEFVVTGNIHTQRTQMILETRDALQGSKAHNFTCAHVTFPEIFPLASDRASQTRNARFWWRMTEWPLAS